MSAKTKLEDYYEFCEANRQADEEGFFSSLAQLWNIKPGTAFAIWYAEQRSWFKPEMIDELVRLDHEQLPFPPLHSGEFTWDAENRRFIFELASREEIVNQELLRVPVVINCARCGGTHESISFEKLQRPMGEHTHWSPCPVNKQPILLKIQSDH